MKKKAV
jgi:serine/threonine protein kinase